MTNPKLLYQIQVSPLSQPYPGIEEAHFIDSSHMEKITVDPQIRFGKPCIAGTRIPQSSPDVFPSCQI